MGILSDLLASPHTFGSAAGQSGNQRAVFDELRNLKATIGDPDYPSGYTDANEVQSIAIYGGSPSAGNVKLTITLRNGTTFTTANIAYNGNTAAIQSAIDTAAALAIPGYVAGDIVVGGGPLTTTPVTLTFSGNSVKNANQGLTTVDASGVTGGTAGAVSTSNQGQAARTGWALLKVLGIVTSAPPNQGVDPSNVTANKAPFPHSLSHAVIAAIIDEIAVEDGNDATKTVLRAALGV